MGEEEEGVGVDVEEEEIIGKLQPCLMQRMRDSVLDLRSARDCSTDANELLDAP